MRVHGLLAGLLGLAIAAPTPQSPVVESKFISRAPECTTAEPDKWLITICGEHATTNFILLDMLDNCMLLSDGVAYEVTTTVQHDDVICYFYDDSAACDSDYMIATVTHHAKLPGVYGRRSRWVMCEKKITEKRTDTVSSLSPRAPYPPIIELAPRAPECVSLEPEKYVITVCGNSTVTNSMPHKELEWCVALSDGLANQVTETLQEENSICKFYDGEDGCNNEFLIATTTKTSQIPRSIGQKIRNMACWKTGDIAEIKAQGEDDSPSDLEAFFQPDESPALVSPVSNCITPNARNHFLNICTEDSYGNAFPNKWMDTCVQLSPKVAHHVTIIVQKPGMMCKFYDDSNGCSGNVRYITKTIDKHHRFEPPAEFGNDLKYALCRRGDWKRDAGELEIREVDTSLEATADQDTTEATTSAMDEPLILKLISSTSNLAIPERFTGVCIKLNDGIAHDVLRASLRRNSICWLYESECDTPSSIYNVMIETEADFEDKSVPDEWSKMITHVKCDDWFEPINEIAAQDENASLEATSTAVTTSAKKPILMAKIFSSTTFIEINTDYSKKCITLIDRITHDVKHSTQLHFATCRFYASGGCGTDPLLTLKAIGFVYRDFAIPEDIGSQITHVKCAVYGFSGIGARDEDTSSNVAVHTASEADPPLMAKIISSTTSMDIHEELANRCKKLNNHVAQDVKYTSLRGDIICAFYENGCGAAHKPLITIRPRSAAYFDEPMASDIGKKVTHVKCGIWNSPGETAMPHGFIDIHARDEDASAADTDTTEESAIADVVYATHMYAENRVASIEDSALGQCYRLPNEVIKQVTWIEQPQGYVCKYYHHDCQDSNMLRSLDSRPGKWSYPTEPEVGTQIEYAMCKHSFDKRDVPVISEGPRDPKVPALVFGQLRIGEDYGNIKRRAVVNALNGCVDIPPPMYSNSTRTLDQSGRSDCEYWAEAACAGDRMLHAINDEKKDWKIRSDFAPKINSAKCTIFESIAPPTASIQARSEPTAYVNAKDIQLTVGQSLSALSTPFLKVGDLYICTEASLDPAHCTVLHTLNQCVTFPGSFAYQAKVITQAKGSFCKYYTKPGCMDGDLYFSYMSNPTQDAQFSGWGVGKLAGVWCGGTGAASTASVNTIPASIDTDVSVQNEKRNTTLTPRGNPFYHWSTSPGSTTVCHQPNYAFCTNNAINALHQCANFAPADQGPASVIQYAGVYCKWYTDFGCASGEHKPYSILDSRTGDMYADGLLNGKDKEVRLYWSVKCEKGVW